MMLNKLTIGGESKESRLYCLVGTQGETWAVTMMTKIEEQQIQRNALRVKIDSNFDSLPPPVTFLRHSPCFRGLVAP